jgi:hypothetical protein
MRSARPVASFFTDGREPNTDSQEREADPVAVDELARQRQKRRVARGDQFVSGTAEPEAEGTLHALAVASRTQQRLRTVAELEALLLKD